MQICLRSGRFIDSDRPALVEFAEPWSGHGFLSIGSDGVLWADGFIDSVDNQHRQYGLFSARPGR